MCLDIPIDALQPRRIYMVLEFSAASFPGCEPNISDPSFPPKALQRAQGHWQSPKAGRLHSPAGMLLHAVTVTHILEQALKVTKCRQQSASYVGHCTSDQQDIEKACQLMRQHCRNTTCDVPGTGSLEIWNAVFHLQCMGVEISNEGCMT